MARAGNETPWAAPLVGRDRTEEHRAATPLELFFDLTFVVAIAAAAEQLHHAEAEGHWAGLAGFLAIFFAIWWAWMNYTWFASAYDTNDVLWRVFAFVQMVGVLLVAAGVPRAFADGDFGVVVLGYVVMRVPQLGQWLRVARADPDGRRTALRYAAGIAVLQALWIARGLLDGLGGVTVLVALVAGELAVPVYAERAGTTPWHPGHLVERYGLMTIIVLGEVILSTTAAITDALGKHDVTGPLLSAVGGGLLIVFSLWWFYFKHSYAERLAEERHESPWLWAYGHFVVYAAVAATGAGLGACIDVVESVAHVSSRAAGLALGVPITVYLVVLGYLHGRDADHWRTLWRGLLTGAAVLGVCALGWEMGLTVLLVGLVLTASLVEYLVVDRDRAAQARNEAKARTGRTVEHD